MKSLNICLIGYGKMGRMIEQIAQKRGHRIVLKIDQGEEALYDSDLFASADVAIEFTSPSSAFANCSRALERGVPVVSGTTAWSEGVEQLREACRRTQGKTFLWASNFSLGVNLFLEINRQVARLMQAVPEYRLSMQEVHHIHKLDEPSGTAITLAETIIGERHDLERWALASEGAEPPSADTLPITALREGEVAGIHQVAYTSEVDRISLEHEAFSREGFALGAVIAAEYASQHEGALQMRDVLASLV